MSTFMGLLGLVAIVVSLAVLFGLAWAGLAGGVALVGVAYSLHTWEQAAARAKTAERRKLRRVA